MVNSEQTTEEVIKKLSMEFVFLFKKTTTTTTTRICVFKCPFHGGKKLPLVECFERNKIAHFLFV